MDRFVIITNSIKDKNQTVTSRIADYLESHNKKCMVLEAEEKKGRTALLSYGCIPDTG